jgi:hypothetical protein
MRCDAIEVFVMCCLDVAGGPGVWVRTRSDIRLRCAPQLVTDDRKQQAYDSDLQARCNAHARLLLTTPSYGVDLVEQQRKLGINNKLARVYTPSRSSF